MVIALSESTAAELIELGAHEVRLIPFGPYFDHYPVLLTTEEARVSFGFEPDDWVVLLIGRIVPYKGADLLLSAAKILPATSRIKVLVAGSCPDENYRNELIRLAGEAGGRAATKLEWIPDEDIARYLHAANIAAFPFREVTNSSSVVLAESFGRPIVIPDLPNLRDVPATSAIRFKDGVEALAAALQETEHLSESDYNKMSVAASAWARKTNWETAARLTIETYEAALCRRD